MYITLPSLVIILIKICVLQRKTILDLLFTDKTYSFLSLDKDISLIIDKNLFHIIDKE